VDLREVIALVALGRAHNLDLAAIGGQVIEDQLGSRCAFSLHPPGDAELDAVLHATGLEALETLDEVTD